MRCKQYSQILRRFSWVFTVGNHGKSREDRDHEFVKDSDRLVCGFDYRFKIAVGTGGVRDDRVSECHANIIEGMFTDYETPAMMTTATDNIR